MSQGRRSQLHRLAARGDVEGVRARLAGPGASRAQDLNSYDERGLTPLMHAVRLGIAGVEVVRLLLAHGARVDAWSQGSGPFRSPVVAHALAAGDPETVRVLVEGGADLHYCYPGRPGYGALLDAVHGRDIRRDASLIDLLRFLVSQGVGLNGVSEWHESGLRVLSHLARFDAVQLLLAAGADETQLAWTPLIRATALGSLAEVEGLARAGAPLEATEWWSRTAWLVAVQSGDLPKARRLRELGALTTAKGRCGEPALVHGIESRRPAMVRWLLEIGADVEETDDFGTPLAAAVGSDDAEVVALLLAAGADVDRLMDGESALSRARSREVARVLLEAGADPRHLSQEGRRSLLGFPSDPDIGVLADVAPECFLRARTARFGLENPEPMREPFWEGMVRAGVSAYEAGRWFGGPDSVDTGTPIWSAQRFGQSLTSLPDGRMVQIGGEHEDSYDSDFCIYNDVFVHGPDAALRIFGYPKAVFPPTDFHTATLLLGGIYVIGGLGYKGERRYGETPVFRLDTSTFRFERIETRGEPPGCLYKHRATAISEHEIRVTGGTVISQVEGREASHDNPGTYVLDVRTSAWRVL